jgi:hypothetical protein
MALIVFSNLLSSLFCFHTETKLFSQSEAQKKCGLYPVLSQPIRASGFYLGHCIWKDILANWSVPQGILTGWPEQYMMVN